MTNTEVDVHKVLENESIIVNTISNTVRALVSETLVNSDKFLVSQVSVNEFYEELSLNGTGEEGRGGINLSLSAAKTTPMLGIEFYFNKERGVFTSEDVNFDITDSSVDNSDPEENFGYWNGLAWDWETMDLNDEFILEVAEKLDGFIGRIKPLEAEIGNTKRRKVLESNPGYLRVVPKVQDAIYVTRTVEYGDYLFDIGSRDDVVGIEALNAVDLKDTEELKIQLHEVGLNEEVEIDLALEVVEEEAMKPLSGNGIDSL